MGFNAANLPRNIIDMKRIYLFSVLVKLWFSMGNTIQRHSISYHSSRKLLCKCKLMLTLIMFWKWTFNQISKLTYFHWKKYFPEGIPFKPFRYLIIFVYGISFFYLIFILLKKDLYWYWLFPISNECIFSPWISCIHIKLYWS